MRRDSLHDYIDIDDDDTGNQNDKDVNMNDIFRDIEQSVYGDDVQESMMDTLVILAGQLSSKEEQNKDEVKKRIQIVHDYLGYGTDFQIMLFTLIYSCYLENDSSMSLRELAKALHIESYELQRHKKAFDDMIENNILMYAERRGRLITTDFVIPDYIINAIQDERPIDKREALARKSMSRFVGQMYKMMDDQGPSAIQAAVRMGERMWRDCEGVRRLVEMIEDTRLRACLYIVMHYRMFRNESASIAKIINDLYSIPKEKNEIRKEFMNGTNELIEKGLVEMEEAPVFENAGIYLTDEALTTFLGEEAESFLLKGANPDLIQSADIVEKQLFYSDEMNKQLDTLYGIMDKENFAAMQRRLDSKGMKKGVAVLLYGAPGTGKTESVLQIAKQTSRAVHHVDISEAKTCFFGESQKRVKKIFTSYKKECKAAAKNNEPLPILLLNEADALISKRKDSNSGNVAQEENAIQNILLEEIENLEGILIATTNLPDNMDAAFERRFLFKVKYEKPDLESRKQIWRSKISCLSDDDIETLAKRYEFSGGEIDNIVRKIDIDEILTGKEPDMAAVIEMCNHEKFNNEESRHIGFGE